MRFDSAGPRTWVLATTAAWAVLSLLLALFGMGGRITPAPEDSALVRPLPALPKAVPERLGPLTQYAETANRPLFADDRRPHPFSLQPQGEDQAKAFNYVLTSVMITPAFKMAIIQAPDASTPPLRIKLGEADAALPSWTLQSLDPRSAVFVGPEGERRLELRVYNGVGGEAPTAVTKTDASPQGRPVVPPAGQAAAVSETPGPQGPAEVAPATAAVAPARTPASPTQPMTEQAQMEAIRKRIEARRAQLRQEAQQQQQQKPPVK
ncbi:general secretion pathway protein GspN [Lysobacter solisilvae (ex Woo and Kim 2020)]|uniref:General secretion pathway protein GspN n=1 Tax=Agrilutibacter terrestris TaxID=2865112 RepID=A0A7H0FZB5_9GAMM|nr:general secretion pathway protein GspN [Lysobacter terrestris]QNP41381.1 general secretion pathway protein GspN [Lysobacter terrestris]